MYSKILVALENSTADDALIPHVAELARHFKSHLLLLHVADGWAARNYDNLRLRESEEMRTDRAYLEDAARQLRSSGLEVSVQLALGSPPEEILKVASETKCDLIAMTGHGHRLLGDILHGSTIDRVRHHTTIPILAVRAGGVPVVEK